MIAEMVGRTVGEWQVLDNSKTVKGDKYWLCRCSCGKEVFVIGKNLRRRISLSCGHNRGRFGKGLSRPKIKDGTGPLRQIYRRYKKQAEQRGYSWDVTLLSFLTLVRLPCHYCSSPPLQVAKHSRGVITTLYNGIDRVDNATGYSTSNIVPCCKICNRAKSDLTLEEFNLWVERLVNTHRDK